MLGRGRAAARAAGRPSRTASLRSRDRAARVARRADWTREEAIVELLRGRLAIVGPTTAAALAAVAGDCRGRTRTPRCSRSNPRASCLRGQLHGRRARRALEWCDRRLLARIHRYTLNRLRAEIEPVSAADFMRFLFAWQHVDSGAPADRRRRTARRRRAARWLRAAGAAWERAVLPARLDRYEPSMLDMLCLTGEVGWAASPARPRTRPAGRRDAVALFLREHADAWQALRSRDQAAESDRAGTEA